MLSSRPVYTWPYEQWRALVAVVDEGGYTAAAEDAEVEPGR